MQLIILIVCRVVDKADAMLKLSSALCHFDVLIVVSVRQLLCSTLPLANNYASHLQLSNLPSNNFNSLSTENY